MNRIRKLIIVPFLAAAALAQPAPAHAFGLTSLWTAMFGLGAGKVNVGDLYARSNHD